MSPSRIPLLQDIENLYLIKLIQCRIHRNDLWPPNEPRKETGSRTIGDSMVDDDPKGGTTANARLDWVLHGLKML
jgi:hypothetical protein